MYSKLSPIKKAIHFIPIPLVWGIIYVNFSCTFQYFCFNESAMKTYPLSKFCINIIFYWCSIMTLICHTLSIITNPGSVNQSIVNHLKPKDKNFCKKCKLERPARAHHCSTCGICILKMDHHCPWIFNCVGFNNQKLFFQFLTYATIGDAIACGCLVSRIIDDSFLEMLLHPRGVIDKRKNIYFQLFRLLKDPLWILMGALLSFAMTLAIGSLFFTQLYLISRNITNVETAIYENNDQCPYYAYKDRWFMFKTVIGLGSRWRWFIPVMEKNKYNGGYTFETPYPRLYKEEKPDKKKKESDVQEDNDDNNGKKKKHKHKPWYKIC